MPAATTMESTATASAVESTTATMEAATCATTVESTAAPMEAATCATAVEATAAHVPTETATRISAAIAVATTIAVTAMPVAPAADTSISIAATPSAAPSTTPVTAVPWAGADEQPTYEPVRAVVAIGSTGVGIIGVVTVIADWRRRRVIIPIAAVSAAYTDPDCHLGVSALHQHGAGNQGKEQNVS